MRRRNTGTSRPISLAELGTILQQRLRSTGGRPALSDATEFCRVPLSSHDVKALEAITQEIEKSTGTSPSPGQVASVIIHSYLAEGAAAMPQIGCIATRQVDHNAGISSTAANVSRLGDIINETRALQKSASAVEAAATEIK